LGVFIYYSSSPLTINLTCRLKGVDLFGNVGEM
jgi:hypothetical protein